MVEYGPTETIIGNPHETYTKELIAAAHVMPTEVTQRASQKGEPLLTVSNVWAGYGVHSVKSPP